MSTRIDGKANANHTHSYLPLSGGTLTGALTVNGEITSSSHVKGQSWVYAVGTHFYVRRDGNLVVLMCRGAYTGSFQLSGDIATIPAGYRPYEEASTYMPLISGNSYAGMVKFSVSTDGILKYRRLDGNSTNKEIDFNMFWYTSSTIFPS